MGQTLVIKNADFSKVAVAKVSYVDPNKVSITILSDNTEYGKVIGSGIYKKGEQVYIEAIPYVGKSFTRWSDGDTNAKRYITADTNKTLTAFFEKDGVLWECKKPYNQCFTGKNDRTYGVTNPAEGDHYKQIIPELAGKTIKAVSIKVINGDLGKGMDISNSSGETRTIDWDLQDAPNIITITLPSPLTIGSDGEIRVNNIAVSALGRSGYSFIFAEDDDLVRNEIKTSVSTFYGDLFYNVK